MTNNNQENEIGQPESVDALSDVDAAMESMGTLDDVESLDSLRQKLIESEKRGLLYQADLENFRRRKSRESQEQLKYASLPLLGNLLEVVDNLERAMESTASDENATSLREGVQIVASQLETTLQNHGCQRIEALGQLFDPNLHEAIQMQPGEQPQNTIVMEVQTGYKLHDRVLRPAKVIISTGPETKSE